jgi:hypothetical protein
MSTSTRARPPAAETRAVEPHTYVFKPGYLEILAGDDPALRDPRTGAPIATLISVAVGLERSTLTPSRSAAMPSATTQGSVVAFLVHRRGYSEREARDALFEHVPLREAQLRAGREVLA